MKLKPFWKFALLVFVYLIHMIYITVEQGFDGGSETNDTVIISDMIEQNENKMIVTVTGEVKKPGKYSVPLGTTMHDIIYYAGGPEESADLSALDLSRNITIGGIINVPAYSVTEEQSVNSGLQNDILININTASPDELCELDGIGYGIAMDIINYREVNGGFKSIEETMNVSGIGTKKYEAIKNKITVGGN